MMDGVTEPNHRLAPLPPPPVLVGPRVGRLRGLFESSSSQQEATPKRKRSVRFEQHPGTSSAIDQLDGQYVEKSASCDDSQVSESRSLSPKSAARLEELTEKLNLDAAPR